MIYLAQPFKHRDHAVRNHRYQVALQTTKWLIEKGHFVYSPIVHSFHINALFEDVKDFSFWRPFDFHMLSKADEMYVMMIEGWEKSVGLQQEMDFAKAVGIQTTNFWVPSIILQDTGVKETKV